MESVSVAPQDRPTRRLPDPAGQGHATIVEPQLRYHPPPAL